MHYSNTSEMYKCKESSILPEAHNGSTQGGVMVTVMMIEMKMRAECCW